MATIKVENNNEFKMVNNRIRIFCLKLVSKRDTDEKIRYFLSRYLSHFRFVNGSFVYIWYFKDKSVFFF